ncbi:MAG: hypothetical protein WA821_18505 [Anaerolineales bacterium]
MRYSICVIDNEIPAAGVELIRDTELLNSSNLQYLLHQEKQSWADPIVKNLIQTLLDAKDEDGTTTWDVYGYTNPAFYINTLDNGTFRPGIIVFDWDYPASSTSENTSETLLKKILDRTFSLVFIFSNAGKQPEIEAILKKTEFVEYQGRLSYLDKTIGHEEQTTALLQQAQSMYETNFSFRFANDLRRKAAQTMDKMLSDMGKASLNDIKNYIAIGDGSKKDFIDFLTENFRHSMASSDIYDLLDKLQLTPGAPALDETLVKKLWSYRLYFRHETGDNLVRCGDVVKTGDGFYLVLSADCDLGHVWKKNLGIINMIALYELDRTNITLMDRLTISTKLDGILAGNFSNLLSQLGDLSQGPFILPFVMVDGSLKSFLAIPKELVSKTVTKYPSNWEQLGRGEKAQLTMLYSYWPDTTRLCTIMEPFLTPVVKHILNTIAGNGVPDYPDSKKTPLVKKILEEFIKANVPTTN